VLHARRSRSPLLPALQPWSGSQGCFCHPLGWSIQVVGAEEGGSWDTIRDLVRDRYAQAAQRLSTSKDGCCGPDCGCSGGGAEPAFGADLYQGTPDADLAGPALTASLGCGVPTSVADLRAGDTVLDLGSGAGADVLISARRVGPTGRAIGLDMTAEMVQLARARAREAGVENAEFLEGYLEAIPLEDGSVDVVISNCVINLTADKRAVLAEAARVLRPGGRFAISDVVADPDLDEATKQDMSLWAGCVAGALTESEYREALGVAGLVDVEILSTHRVHAAATAAIIRARRPPIG
jgi:SAM-dependent methyltransferase